MRTLRPRPLTCKEIVELVTEYLEGALTRRDRRRFQAHLSGCEHCTEFLRQMRTTVELTGTLTVDDLSVDQQRALLALFRHWNSSPG